MTRFKILALLATVALLALLPFALYGQDEPTAPHRFYGTATTSDGTVAADGTVVTALFGDEEVATATVASTFEAGFYLVDVPEPTGTIKVVTFKVGAETTSDSVTWASKASEDRDLTGIVVVPTATPAPRPGGPGRPPRDVARRPQWDSLCDQDGLPMGYAASHLRLLENSVWLFQWLESNRGLAAADERVDAARAAATRTEETSFSR